MVQRLGMASGLPDKEVALAWTCRVAGHVAEQVAGQVAAGIGLGVQRGI